MDMKTARSLASKLRTLLAAAVLGSPFVTPPAHADEGGASPWWPGQMAGVSSTPSAPGKEKGDANVRVHGELDVGNRPLDGTYG
jgi:hypothetical protein